MTFLFVLSVRKLMQICFQSFHVNYHWFKDLLILKFLELLSCFGQLE